MSRSPGHRQWPQHKVKEQIFDKRLRVRVGDEIIADSEDVIRVEEDGNPARYYFPRGDVRVDLLERSDTTTQCPFKGTARYFNLRTDGRELDDAVWSYEDPYEEHAGLKGRLAFYPDKIPELKIQAAT
jgi:uncharacterized protein (DUF427 family)